MNHNNTVTMVPTPQRKNRRRERPGARKRHALALAHEVAEGMSIASDFLFDFPLPNHHSHASPRQHLNYDRNWKAWKQREEESREAAMDSDRHSASARARGRENEEFKRLFGGGEDDDVSLCENMLGVVYSLFGQGCTDYIDP